jgi:hypothetical protein
MDFADRWSVLKDELPLPPSVIPPLTVFMYTAINEKSLKNLSDRAIYFNSPRNFNDPYDCAMDVELDEPSEDGFEIIRRAVSARAGSRASAELDSFSEDECREKYVRISKENFRAAKEDFLNLCCRFCYVASCRSWPRILAVGPRGRHITLFASKHCRLPKPDARPEPPILDSCRAATSAPPPPMSHRRR